MEQLYDKLVQVLSVLDDDVKVLEVLSIGLGAEGDCRTVAIVDMQKRIINLLLNDVQGIITRIDVEN